IRELRSWVYFWFPRCVRKKTTSRGLIPDEVILISGTFDLASVWRFLGLLRLWTSASKSSPTKVFQDVFELYNLNKNGLISAKELHQILSQLGERCTIEDCTDMIKSVDSDGDGYVNNSPYETHIICV
ncbi:Calcium-binding EF-hand, partial [Cynara cardunculus var. scolymus]